MDPPCKNCFTLPICIRQDKTDVKNKCVLLKNFLIQDLLYLRKSKKGAVYTICHIALLEQSYEVIAVRTTDGKEAFFIEQFLTIGDIKYPNKEK